MPLKKVALKTTEAHRGKRLDQVLAEWLPVALGQPISKSRARLLIVAGAVYLNGTRVRIASKTLLPGARVEAFVDLTKLAAKSANEGPGRDRAFTMGPERILFEDPYIIVVDKPHGLPTQPTLDEARDNLFAALKRFMAKRDGVTDPYVALHHRLDRDTSGIVLFAKAQAANAGVSELFSKHLAQKTYNAISVRAEGLPQLALEPRWTVKNYLARATTSGKKSRFHSVRSGGDFAHTDFRLIQNVGGAYWVEARPLTGRTHQIRVHLSEAGLPILGDENYGGASTVGREPERQPGVRPGRMMLHALCLEFPHPITGKPIRIDSPLPDDFRRTWAALDRLT